MAITMLTTKDPTAKTVLDTKIGAHFKAKYAEIADTNIAKPIKP